MIIRATLGLMAVGFTLLSVSCSNETPNRNYIPVIKDRLYLVQEALRTRNSVGLDSLVSEGLREDTASFRNMIELIYGRGGDFTFQRFGDCEIVYNDNAARADCFSLDLTGQRGRALIVTLERHNKIWLLKRIQEAHPSTNGESL